MARCKAIFFWILVLFISTASLVAQPVVPAHRAAQQPRLDGDFDDDIWQKAQWQSGFSELGSDRTAVPNTRFAVAYDQQFLYVAIRCGEPKLDQLKASVTKRDDSNLYNDDVVDLFVAPGAQRTYYYQFEVNAKGVVADAVGLQSGTVRDPSWNSGVQAKTKTSVGEWAIEMAVPLADLELGAAVPGNWGINVARMRRASGEGIPSTFVPMTGSFHQPALFADLAFPAARFDPLRWEVSPPLGLVVRREKGQILLHAKLNIKNLTGSLLPVLVQPSLRQNGTISEGTVIPDMLDANQSKTYAITVPLSGEGAQDFQVEIRDRRDPKSLFARRAFGVNLAFVPLALVLRQPAYHDAIFATDTVNHIVGSLQLALAPDEIMGISAVVSLSFADHATPPLATTTLTKLSSNVDFSLPIPDLAVGRYRLRVALMSADGKEGKALERVIRKLPPAPGGIEWRIDEHGILLRNGKPFLPVGWFSLDATAIKDSGGTYNVSWTYLGPWKTVEQVRKALDEIAASGGYAVIYPTTNNQRPEELTSAPLAAADIERIRERVRQLKDHPALLAWYLADEPECNRVLPEAVEQLRAILAEEDPYHPTLVVNNSFGAIRRYAQSSDILAPDSYPYFKRGGFSPAIGKIAPAVAEAVAVAMPGQSAWAVLQAHDTRDFGGEGERAPTFVESRNMVWQAVIAGARGFIWWAWDWASPNTLDSVQGNAYLARELAALNAYVLAPETGLVEFAAVESKDLWATCRRVGSQQALFAVNSSTKPQDVAFKQLSLAGSTLTVIGEGRTLKVTDDGTLLDHFLPYATHLYVTDSAFATSEPLAAVQKKIDAANAARKRPGNLAFEDSGVMVEASSRGSYRPAPVWVVDGMRDGKAWQGQPFTGTEWFALTWAAPQKIRRVAIYTDTIADCELQIANGESGGKPVWSTVATVKAASTNPVELAFNPVEAATLRVLISKLRPGAPAARISEVEVYEKKRMTKE